LADVVGLLPGWWDGTPADLARLAERLRQDGAAPAFSLAMPDGTIAATIDARVLRDGAVTLIGLQRDPGPPGNAAALVLTLARPGRVYDLRRHADLGWASRLVVPVGAAEPVVLAVSPAALPRLAVAGPTAARAGEDVVLRIGSRAGTAAAAARVVQVRTLDPDGRPVPDYSGNLTLRGAPAAWRLPLALNDRAGVWTVRVSDRLGADVRTWRIAVRAAFGGAGRLPP
jgi:hypothetical protein